MQRFITASGYSAGPSFSRRQLAALVRKRFPQVCAFLSVRSAMGDEDGYFGERVAARYDDSLADMFEPSVVDAAVEVLAELAGGGRALELGIGTGRIALAL